jgi:hypothetical protein
MSAVPELLEIAAAWQGRVSGALRRALLGTLLCTLVGAVLLGRHGTVIMRVAGVTTPCVLIILTAGRWWWQRRRANALTLQATALVQRLNPPLAAQLRRAIELCERTRLHAPQVSQELANLHLSRSLAQVPLAAIEELAAARAASLNLYTMLVIAVCLGYLLVAPARAFEGFDVLLAHSNVAPLPMNLVEFDEVVVQPPGYLHGAPNRIEFDSTAAAPWGSLVIVHGTPRRAGRSLVLTDGTHEVPFVSDGQGGVTARYLLQRSAQLRVATRFGSVLLHQASLLALEAIADLAPMVELEGAPRRLSLADFSSIDLHYRTTDDHGIRQIDLVLRAGPRQERRSLVRLDGETQKYVGAYVLDANDAFVNDCYGSVEVVVAARDDNSLETASWGESPVITLDKPSIGRAQVRRRDAYLALRDKLVDWLAVAEARPTSNAQRKERKVQALAELKNVDSGLASDTRARKAMRSFLRAQRDKLLRAEHDDKQLALALEEATLAVDSAIEAIGRRDAEHVARLLSDVAVEIELGAKAVQLGEHRDEDKSRVNAAHSTLAAGAAELRRLGAEGADLGEIAQAGWARIGRVLATGDFENAQRAAAFLAERLRRPRPSFVGGGRAGIESRASPHGRGMRPRASEADAHLERVAAELQQLVRAHAAEIESVERMIGDSEQGLGSETQRPGARQHAHELRRIVEGLPPVGADRGGMGASLSLAKELVNGAAESLEQLQLGGAHEGLRKADAALAEAELLREPFDSGRTKPSPRELQEMRNQLAQHRDWLKRALDDQQRSALGKARELFKRAAAAEREIAERANSLAQREAKHDAVLPDDIRTDLEQAARLMRRAAELLDASRGPAALDQQRQAQNLLERNEPDAESTDPGPLPGAGKNGRNARARASSRDGTVVSTSDAEGREAFRRRVQKGLSREVAPELSPAIRRYAEGLLK